MKLERKPSTEELPAHVSGFSKVANLKLPDSPPPEPEKEEPYDPKKPNKFEQLMKAACSIKQTEMESKRKKFEIMPAFLKAGVYYTTKLECVREQPYFQRLFAHELLVKNANVEFYQGNFDSACRKYEEAYSIWRYHKSTNSKWNTEGIDDTQLTEVDWLGKTKFEREAVKKHKILTLLNITACNLKTQNWEDALSAVNAVLEIDPTNKAALFRRAKGKSLPINAGVEDFKSAVKDLKAMKCTETKVTNEIERLNKLINLNTKRERETYSKMFAPRPGQQGGQAGLSVTEYVQKVEKEAKAKNPDKFKTVEEKDMKLEMEQIDREVAYMVETKKKEFSFEVSDEIIHHEEIQQLTNLVDKGVENYKMFKKIGQADDALEIKQKIKEMKFAKEHLILVMNLDFTKPTQKMKEMAVKANIDLKDEKIIEEFRIIQKQNLEDIRRLRDGKMPLTEEELKNERAKLLIKMQDDRLKKEIEQQKAEIAKQRKSTDTIVKMIETSHENVKNAKEQERLIKESQARDLVILAVLVFIWLLAILYFNYFSTASSKSDSSEPSATASPVDDSF